MVSVVFEPIICQYLGIIKNLFQVFTCLNINIYPYIRNNFLFIIRNNVDYNAHTIVCIIENIEL